ncbi:unnamed protein product [Clonostachys rosea f. rosea IK726]|uniref:Uncharacterized protein n=2 Tax=Bionectria ochroleuca TaxID=29856 RepID=A0ACA9TGV0_BIOOC|nr:unnamed protein product [Clonostachys rosea f. rosea IK726]
MQIENNSRNRPVVQLFDDRPSINTESGIPTPVTSIQTIHDICPPIDPPIRSPVRDEGEKAILQAFFDSKDATKCIFLHAPTIMAEWKKGGLDPVLVKTMCATGLGGGNCRAGDRERVASWFRDAQAVVLSCLGTLSLSRLQALVLIIHYHYENGETVEAWNLLAVAARLGFTLKLNHERSTLSPIAQESGRRLMWHIYLFDRIFSGGLEDLEVCPVSRMLHLRLPSEDRSFERGMPSRAQYLFQEESDNLDHSDIDLYSYILRIYASRDRILRYTKRICREGACPLQSNSELSALERELTAFGESLPADIQLSPGRISLMAQSRDASGYIRLHTVWLQCYIDLYRFLVPGIRESVSNDVIKDTPDEYVSYCQNNVLTRIFQLFDLWSEFFKDRENEPVKDIYFVVSLYQASQIIDNLQHLLQPNNPFGDTEDIRKKLQTALDVVYPELRGRFPRMKECLREIRRVINTLGLTQPTNASLQQRKEFQKDKYHLISRGSVIPRESESDEGSDPPHQDSGLLNEQELSMQSWASDDITRGRHTLILREDAPVTGSQHNEDSMHDTTAHMGSTFNGFELEGGTLDTGLVPWDPFAGHFADNYGSEFDLLGMHTRM